MGFNNLQHGWIDIRFTLEDVKLVDSIRLYKRKEDGELELHRPVFIHSAADEERFEKANEFRYVDAARQLRAYARIDMEYWNMFVGVPKNKERVKTGSIEPLGLLEMHIYENSELRIEELVARGSISHFPPTEDFGGLTYAELGLPIETFDKVERIAGQSDVDISIVLNLKCWHWKGPIGDGEFYIDESKDKAELAELIISRKIADSKDNEMRGSTKSADPTPREYTRLGASVEKAAWAVWTGAALLTIAALSLIL